MEASHVLATALQIYLVFLNIFYVISVKKCGDVHCKVPISFAVAVEDHESLNGNYISFKKGDTLTIFSKNVDDSIWQGSLGGAPAGLLRGDFVIEKKKIYSDDQLVEVASDSEGNPKAAENGEPSEESEQHKNEMEEDVTEIEDELTESLDDPEEINNSPAEESNDSPAEESNVDPEVAPSTEDLSQAENKHQAKENEDDGKQNKITNDNGRTAQLSESDSSSKEDMKDEGGEHLNDENYDSEVVMASDERSKKTGVYTDPGGVQYDVEVVDITQERNDEIEIVKVTEQKLSDVDEDGKLASNKENYDKETSDDGSKGTKKAGFFSSIGDLVSDFTGNIIKDFQGEGAEIDKVTKDELTEDPAKHENTEEKENIKEERSEEEPDRKPSQFKGLQEKFQQMKAARLERMREHVETSEAKIPPVHKDEILREEAKRMVEGIPALMNDEKESTLSGDEQKNKGTVESETTVSGDEQKSKGTVESETTVSGDEQKSKGTVESETTVSGDEQKSKGTVESVVATENQKFRTRQYSYEELCSSVGVEKRDVCMVSGSKDECLQDNCCYDGTAEPGKQCFFKPSSPESTNTEQFISKEEERLKKDNNAAVETDEHASIESAKSTTSEPPHQTADVSDDTNGSSDMDSARQADAVDESRDEIENTTETKITESVEKTNDEVDTRHEEDAPADAVRKVGDLDEINEASREDSSRQSRAVETIDDTASKRQGEDSLPETRNDGDAKQEDVQTEKGEKDVKTQSVDNHSSEDNHNIDTQKSSDASENADLSDEMTSAESKEKQNDELRSVDEPSTTTANIEQEDPPSREHTTEEEEDVESRATDVSSSRDLKDDTSQDLSTKQDGDDMAEQETRSSVGSKEDQKEVTGENDDKYVEKDDREPKDSLEKVESEDDADGQDEMRSGDNDARSETAEESAASVSDKEVKSEQGSPGDDITGGRDREEKTEAPREEKTGTPASLVEDIFEENQEVFPEDKVGEKKEDKAVDVDGIMDNINILLPGNENTTDKGHSSEDVRVSKDENVEKMSREGEDQMSSEDGEGIQDQTVNVPHVEGIMDKIKKMLPGGTTEEKHTKDKSETLEHTKNMLADIPEEESFNTKDSTDTIIAEDTRDIEEKSVDSGSTHFLNVTEPTLTVEKTLDKRPELNDSTSQGSEETKTEIEETKTEIEETKTEIEETKTEVEGTKPEIEETKTEIEETKTEIEETKTEIEETKTEIEETKTEIEETKTEVEETKTEIEETKTEVEGTKPGVEETKTEVKPDIVPTQASNVVSYGTTTAGHRPFEKKFPNIASKWMKNKLMKGKRISEEGSGEEIEIPSNVRIGEEPHSETGVPHSRPEDPHSGTCAKDGTCEGTVTLSSSITRSLLEDDDIPDLDDDDIVEPRPEIEGDQPEAKSIKTQFLETLAVAVGKFREYHSVVADYGLQVLKPVKNVTKLLGEQMGLGETIDYMEREMKHGPQGVIAVALIMMAFAAYFMLSVLCGKKVPPCYGPNLKDIFKTYEGRIRILEEECTGYEERINNMKNKADEDVENSSALVKQLDDEKHKRNKSEEQISILKEIVKNLNEKVVLLEEESSKLKQSLDQKTGRISTLDKQLSKKSKEIETTEEKIKELEAVLNEKDEEKSALNENIDEYKTQLSKAEDDTDRHKTMLQDWNDRYHELQQKYDDISVSNQTLEEQIHFKDNEIGVLRDSLVQINSDVHINSDEELSQEEMQEARSTKIQQLMDVSQIRTDYKLCKEEKEQLEDDITQEMNKREKLEGEVEQLEIDLAKSKATEEEIRFKYREADIKLNALQDYFKNMESDLHRKLTAEEAARMASESELERKLREASTAVQDVELYRKQVDELRKEIDETQQAFRSQTSSTEERAHENWLKFRSAERELEEMKRERDALRRRLYDLETSSKAPVEELVPITSTTSENLESPVSRSESPATSLRSSKRKNSNLRKSPSESPLDERKERVRRKPRDRNSPPSWEPDMGLQPRKRDKDRVTPPPPPPLWDPNMGLPARRKGHSPIVPTTMDIDSQRRRRFTPSPPPPPDPRRRRRDRPVPSSPPLGMIPPRGGSFPMERPPPPPPNIPQFSTRGGPPRMNTPLMAPQLSGGRINGVPFQEQSPSPTYIRRGGDVNTVRPPVMTAGPPIMTAGPPTNISPLRGTLPQGGPPNDQTLPYNNSNISNNTRDDRPPPPPVFSSNGPYPRTPPKKIPTLPS